MNAVGNVVLCLFALLTLASVSLALYCLDDRNDALELARRAVQYYNDLVDAARDEVGS